MKRHVACFLLTAICFGISCREQTNQQVVENGSFEDIENSMPRYWKYGFEGEPLDPSLGTIAVEDGVANTGNRSLRLNPTGSEGVYASQILHGPTYDLTGKKVRLTASIRTENLTESAFIFLIAYNPKMPKDLLLKFPSAGKAVITKTSEGAFTTFSSQFIARGKAEFLLLIAGASGEGGTAWIDDINVSYDVTTPGPGPDEAGIAGPALTGRTFSLGVTSENPIDYSDKAIEDMVDRAGEIGDMINLFFHVKYNALRGSPMLAGHDRQLIVSDLAKNRGLARAVTLDFTHGSATTVGSINPMPDGTPVPSLDEKVRQAYLDELMAICEYVEPTIVIVGIETDIFREKHPDQWDNYVTMYKNAYSRVKSRFPGAHVTAYFTITWMVDGTGAVNQEHKAVWQMLLPELDSIAYSTYPSYSRWHTRNVPPGFFTAPSEVAPELPLAICEFGMRSDGAFNETDQADMLRKILDEVGAANPLFLVWFSLYDQQYLGAPPMFRTQFRKIGLRQISGTPKQSWYVMKKSYELH